TGVGAMIGTGHHVPSAPVAIVFGGRSGESGVEVPLPSGAKIGSPAASRGVPAWAAKEIERSMNAANSGVPKGRSGAGCTGGAPKRAARGLVSRERGVGLPQGDGSVGRLREGEATTRPPRSRAGIV